MESSAGRGVYAAGRSSRRALESGRYNWPILSSAGPAAAGLLVLFHAVLFWSHVTSGRISEPGVALRWSIGLLLLGLLVALRRVGVPVLWGRRALVVWVLVALLHVSTAPATADSITSVSPADVALSLVILPPAAGLVFTAGLLLLGAVLARAWRVAPAMVGFARRDAAVRLRSRLRSASLASRAPPLPESC